MNAAGEAAVMGAASGVGLGVAAIGLLEALGLTRDVQGVVDASAFAFMLGVFIVFIIVVVSVANEAGRRP